MADLQAIPWSLVLPLLIIQFVLSVIALIDLIKYKETKGPIWIWAVIILFVSILGPILYFTIGRKQN